MQPQQPKFRFVEGPRGADTSEDDEGGGSRTNMLFQPPAPLPKGSNPSSNSSVSGTQQTTTATAAASLRAVDASPLPTLPSSSSPRKQRLPYNRQPVVVTAGTPTPVKSGSSREPSITLQKKVAQMEDAEKVRRVEIYSAWEVSHKMFLIAASKLKGLRAATNNNKSNDDATSGGCAPVRKKVFIHHKDVNLMDELRSMSRARSEAASVKPPPTLPKPRKNIDGVVAAGEEENEEKEEQIVAPKFPDEVRQRSLDKRLGCLSAVNIPPERPSKPHIVKETFNFLDTANAVDWLSEGDALFRLVVKPGEKLAEDEVAIVNALANETCFADEVAENNVPIINLADPKDKKKYTVIIAKAMYLLPGVGPETMTAEMIHTAEYQRACQPGKPKVWDIDTPMTFRSNKVIIKFMYSIIVQMRCSNQNDRAYRERFTWVDGFVPGRIVLIERTKRNIKNVDSTAKCKSVLFYTAVDGGLLCSHMTVVFNTFIPGIIASIIQKFPAQGAAEAAETADLTRRFLRDKIGDSREGPFLKEGGKEGKWEAEQPKTAKK